MIYRLVNSLHNLENINSPYNYDNHAVPRVTDIIGIFQNEQLLKWSNSLGFRKLNYEQELNRLANIGTLVHAEIDNFIKNKIEGTTEGFKAFLRWWNDINKGNKVKIIYNEYTVIGKNFGGTIDLLISINDRLYIVDFKTSNVITYKHFLQLAAYRYLLQSEKSVIVDGVIILQLNKYKPEYQEYMINIKNYDQYQFIESCEKTFLSLVYSYYNLYNIKNSFNNIFTFEKL